MKLSLPSIQQINALAITPDKRFVASAGESVIKCLKFIGKFKRII